MDSPIETETDSGAWRKWVRAAVMLMIGIAAIGWLLTQVTLSDFRLAWGRMDWTLIALATALGLSTTLVRALRYAVFFGSQGRAVRLYGVFAQWRFVNMLLPFKTGEVAALVMLKKYGISASMAETAPTWLVIRTFDLLAVVAWLGALLLIAEAGLAHRAGMEQAPAILSAIAIAAVLGLAVGYWLVVGVPIKESAQSWLAQRVRVFRDGIDRVRAWRKVAACGLLSLLLWAIAIAVPTTLQFAFGVSLTVFDCVWITMIVLVASMLPVHAPLALGTGDLVWAGAFLLFGLPESEAIAIAISIRLVMVVLICLDGALGTTILTASPAPPRPTSTAQ